MCPPTEFNIPWEINPWMKKTNQPNQENAWAQWHRIVEIYQKLGIRIYLIRPVAGLSDMIFTANAAWGRKGVFVLSNFRRSERQPEHQQFELCLEKFGFKTIALPSDIYFEGQGDVVTLKEAYLFGWGFRSSFEAHQCIKSSLNLQKPIISLHLANEWFYHLDTCLMYLYPIDTVMYYPGAFDGESQMKIKKLDADKIEVTEEEAKNLICNGVYYDETIVLSKGSPRIERILRKRGLEVIRLDMSEFKKSGAGARCLTLFID